MGVIMATLTSEYRSLYNTCNFHDLEQRIFFTKSYCPSNNQMQYFFHAYLHQGAQLINQGYIYFYINDNTSTFIGSYTNPKYRNEGINTLLISCWIKYCLDHDITILTTNKKQRKPFLVYLLKTFFFELEDISLYEINPFTIYICRKENDLNKYLYFKSEGQRKSFSQGKIVQRDNYKIIDTLSHDIEVLDQVLLSTPYYLSDENKAYNRSLSLIKKHER